MSEDYFNEDKSTIFEDKQTLFLDYKDWGVLIEDVYTLILYNNNKCLQKYKDQLDKIAEAKQNLTEALGIYENFEKQTPGRYAKMINFISFYLSSI